MNNQSTKISSDSIRRILTYVIFLVVVFGFLFSAYLLIPPLVQKNYDQFVANEQAKKDVAIYKHALEVLNSTDSTNLEENVNKATMALPDEKKVSGLITGLNILAGDAPVVIKHLDFSPGEISTIAGAVKQNSAVEKKLPEGVLATMVQVEITGRIDGVTKFISNLNKVSQLIGVQNVDLREDVGGGYVAKINLQLYFQPRSSSQVVWKNLEALTEEDQQVINSLTAKDVFVVK